MSDHSSKNINESDKDGIEYFNKISGTSNSSTGQYVSETRTDLNPQSSQYPSKVVKSINEKYLNQVIQPSVTDNIDTRLSGLSEMFEGYSSTSSINSRFVDGRKTDERRKNLLAFVSTESSIMFYPNICLIICSIVLMLTSDKYISNIDITRTFLYLESNKPILLCLYSGFIMMLLCICLLYGAITIHRKLCYLFGLGITMINRIPYQQTLVRRSMKSSFSNYATHLDTRQNWDYFQIKFTCCGVDGKRSYLARSLKLPNSCCENKCNDWLSNSYKGCYHVVKTLEEKYLDPVIISTLICSLLQMSNAILILNLLRPKPKSRRYHIA